MPTDPVEEWRRLSALYSEMGDLEIEELANQIKDLTPTAQQILRDEMKKRGISTDPAARYRATFAFQNGATVQGKEFDTSADPDREEGDGELRDYTWKVGLCRCESLEEAAGRSEMLRRAGIESWIQRPESRYVVAWMEAGEGDIQINVAADQLDHAQSIILQPVPQDIIEELKEQAAAPEYELPTCPRCKSPDPILETVEPSNNWLCESCGHAWSDPLPDEAA